MWNSLNNLTKILKISKAGNNSIWKWPEVLCTDITQIRLKQFDGLTFLLALQVEGETTGQSGLWLQDCIVSLSPCSDLLVVAREQKAVFLSGQIFKHTDSSLTRYTEELYSILMPVFIDFLQRSGVQMIVAERRWPWLCLGVDPSALTKGKSQTRITWEGMKMLKNISKDKRLGKMTQYWKNKGKKLRKLTLEWHWKLQKDNAGSFWKGTVVC